MEIRQLRTFLAVANARSFLGAEETLFISRQAISKTIDQLESELNTTLFLRNPSGVMMTPAGIFFYSRASALVADFDRFHEEMQNIGRTYRTTVTICVSLGLYTLFAEKLEHFSDMRKNEMELLINERLESDCGSILADRKADGVISFSPLSTHTSDSSSIMESPLVLLVPRYIYLQNNTMDELLQMPRLLYSGGQDRPMWMQEETRPRDFLSSDFGYLFTLFRNGKGVMPIPKVLAPTYSDYADIVPLPQKWPRCKFYFSTLYSSYYDAITYGLLDEIHDELVQNQKERGSFFRH